MYKRNYYAYKKKQVLENAITFCRQGISFNSLHRYSIIVRISPIGTLLLCSWAVRHVSASSTLSSFSFALTLARRVDYCPPWKFCFGREYCLQSSSTRLTWFSFIHGRKYVHPGKTWSSYWQLTAIHKSPIAPAWSAPLWNHFQRPRLRW